MTKEVPALRVSAATFSTGFDPLGWAKSQGLSPTSGYRSPAHQASLVAQGLTQTRHGSHQTGDGIDFSVPRGMSKQDAIAMVRRQFPGARAIPSNGSAIHVTFPGWGGAPDISGSRRRFGGK